MWQSRNSDSSVENYFGNPESDRGQPLSNRLWQDAQFRAGMIGALRTGKDLAAGILDFATTENDLHSAYSAERNMLCELATKLMSDSANSQFIEAMNTFERRAKSSGLSNDEINATYKELAKLMTSIPDGPVPLALRTKVALQLMNEFAEPTHVDQVGNTCGAAAIQARLCQLRPSDVARLVAEVATKGKYTSAFGIETQIGANNLVPHTGEHSFANQLFQATCLNIHTQSLTESPFQCESPLDSVLKFLHLSQGNSVPKGSIRYEIQNAPKEGDSGERLVDYSKNPPQVLLENGKEAQSFGLTPDHIVEISSQITGLEEEDSVIQLSKFYGNKVDQISTVEQLRERLKNGRLPATVVINVRNEPFLTDSGYGESLGSGGSHVVNVTAYDPKSDHVAIDNFWGDQNDRLSGSRLLSSEQLFKALDDPPEKKTA